MPARLQKGIQIAEWIEIVWIIVTVTVITIANVIVNVSMVKIVIGTVGETAPRDKVILEEANRTIHLGREKKLEAACRRVNLHIRQAHDYHRIVRNVQKVDLNQQNVIVYCLNGEATTVRRLTTSPKNLKCLSRTKRKNAGFVHRQPNCTTNEMHRMKWNVRPDWMHCAICSTKSSSKGADGPELLNPPSKTSQRKESTEFVDTNVISFALHPFVVDAINSELYFVISVDNCSSSDSSEEEFDIDEDCPMVELTKKIKHPYRLHADLWHNESGEMNDGPLCRCSVKSRRTGIRHGIYPGENGFPKCSASTNNAGKLYHYRITISPPTNFLTKTPTIIKFDQHEFIFEGFSLLSHQPIGELPTCKVIRFNIEYTIMYVEEEMPENFTIRELDLFCK